jgi:hypothetical protein
VTPEPNQPVESPPSVPFPELDPSATPQEAPQPDPTPGEADTGRPHDMAGS